MNRLLAAALLLSVVSVPAFGQQPRTASTDFEISLEVESTGCAIGIEDVPLGLTTDDDFQVLSPIDIDIVCSREPPRLRLALGLGQNPRAGALRPRHLNSEAATGPTHFIPYSLFLSLGAGSFEVDDEPQEIPVPVPEELRLFVQARPRIAVNGAGDIVIPRAGPYSDTVTATIEY